ncbi:MAG: 5-(carboxyamino)imidazole ribonucleotide synthase [Endomicrobiia bacterium]
MTPITKINLGIIGGGQLGKMLILAARTMGIYNIVVIDPEKESPAGKIADEHIVARWDSEEAIKKLAKKVDIITYEVEHTNVSILKHLEDKGYIVRPSGYVLEIIQDKLKQKQFLLKNKIPTTKLLKIFPQKNDFVKIKLPVVQKTCKGGYDGRGVLVIKNVEDIKNIFTQESFLEEYVNIKKELSVLVARGSTGEIKTYPVVEMCFNEKNICDTVIAPARIEKKVQKEAIDIGIKCVKNLNGIGIFAIELFLTKDNRILVNEISPRVHNSGHYTIDATKTSQFEQHLRAISGLPLGSTELLSKAIMINILGCPDYRGRPVIEGIEKVLAMDGVKFHFYDKKITFPYRKMGHITILDKSIPSAIKKSLFIKKILKIKSQGG